MIDLMTPRELSSIMWALAELKHMPDDLYLECWCV